VVDKRCKVNTDFPSRVDSKQNTICYASKQHVLQFKHTAEVEQLAQFTETWQSAWLCCIQKWRSI